MDNDSVPELNSIWDEARNYIKSGNRDKAIEIYRYILVRYGDNDVAVGHANAYLADIFLALRELELAEDHIKKALKYDREKPDYHYILGFVYSIRRMWDDAIQEFEIATAHDPNNGEYLRGLGWVIFQGKDKNKGLDCLHKANQLAPNNPNILCDLAVAHIATMDFVKAEEYALQAVTLEPQNPFAQGVLKDIHRFQQDADRILKKPKVKVIQKKLSSTRGTTVYIFRVSLKEQPDVWRIIEIKHNQMLSSLHKAIFNAFDRYDEHLYSFFMNNEPWDNESEYNLPDPDEPGLGKPAQRARIDSLYLKPSQKFLYVFDYGDEWWHEVEFIGTSDANPLVKYPRVTKKLGKSPPQYSDDAER